MPISSAIFANKAATETEMPPERKPRQNKADRPFSPPGLRLEPSDYVRSALEGHYVRLDQDADYRKSYEEFRLSHWEKNIAKERSLKEWLAKQTEPAPLRVRGSEIKTCARQTFFRLLRVPGKPIGEESPHWRISAISGDHLHEEIEIALRFLGMVEKAEYNVRSPNNDYGGRVDIRLKEPAAILDIKTVKPEDFKEGPWAEKVPGYVDQINGYAHLEKLSLGIVLMIDRGSGRMKEFSWEVLPEDGEAVLQRAADIVVAAKERRIPEAEWRAGGKTDFRCRTFCPFEELCYRQERDGSIQAKLDTGATPEEL